MTSELAINVEGKSFRSRAIVADDGSLKESETIESIASFESNLYVGSSLGQILHYHRFDDAPDFMLISQQQIRKSPITKMIVLPKSERLVVLCGSVLNLYSLPELSPVQSGKLKEVEDISLFQGSDLVVVTADKIRLVRFIQNEVKLLKMIPVKSAIRVVSHKSSRYLTVATDREYQLINIEDSTVVPLFQYTNNGAVGPKIVPFKAKDSRKQEMLLVIEADNSSTMGMFISDNGEPTRGTLSLIEKGNPDENSQIVVVWPYVYGIFENGKLLVASLLDLEVKSEIDISPGIKLAHLPNKISVQNDLYAIDGFSETTTSSTVVICDSHTVSVLLEESRIAHFKDALTAYIKGDASDLQLLEDENDGLYNQLLFIYLLYKKEYQNVSKFMDDAFNDIMIYIYDPSYPRKTRKIYKVVQDMCDLVRDKLDGDFRAFALETVRSIYLSTHDPHLKQLAYSVFQSDKEFISFSNKDKQSWRRESDMSSTIDQLEAQGLHLAVLHSYVMLNKSQNICSVATKFFAGECKSVDQEGFNFVDIILAHLDKVEDAEVYRDSLLEVLRVDSKRGLQYMKKNVNGKHKSTYNEVLKSVSNLSNDENFGQLKLEVLENEYKEGRASTVEILEHLLTMLQFPNEVATNNFMILYQTFLIENTFDNHQGIISWPQFLQSVKSTTECEDFITLYLKTFELLNLHGISNDSIRTKLETLLETDTYSYFQSSIVAEDKVERLLQFQDYVAAEYCCIYNKAPYPSVKYFLGEGMVDQQKSDACTQKLQYVFQKYRDDKNMNAMRHFINNYGTYFNPVDVIDMLPQDFSIVYAQEYFTNLFIELEGRHRLQVLKKIFNKQEAKTNKELYTHVLK